MSGREAEIERPLPQPTLASAEFWASGADGILRISRCADCGKLLHPQPSFCPRCRGRNAAMQPVSGRAVIVGVTINAHQWLPGLPPPYVIAIVALDEDPSVRLTTNIVGCEPADAVVGARVRVVFEHMADDIWLPLFELDPAEAGAIAQLPEPEEYRARLRAPVSSDRFEHRVAITGVGQSRVGRRLMVDPLSLTVDACLRAIEDAGLSLDDIDGLSTYPGGVSAGFSEGGIVPLEQALQIRPTWVNGGGDLPGQTGSIIAAMLAVASGLCRHVLCFRTVWESSHAALTAAGKWTARTTRATGAMEFRHPYGAMSAANWIACQASHYFHRYGDAKLALGAIAVNARANAAVNPEAVYRKPITIEDYLSARPITTPFGLLDCDVPVDGSVAVIVSARETTKDLRSRPVFIEAVGTQIMEHLSWDQGTLTHLPQSLGPSAHLWSRTELRPEDVDVALLYDGFTFNALSWLEGLGFCEFGEAPDFIDGGRGIAIDGRLPINPHGGQLSAGRTHGYGFFREAVLQLRGQAPGRQVAEAHVAVATAGGGVPGSAILLRTD
ncbi:thiolase C-terminal domain-containing protein [Nocardia cyriacigeorgica]|uniref:thiolase C-terminal domain-containing protein n=1 Tax=Nocardia cyriacigeorgica TaxID=135487 RepID=UPI002457D590|nr:OB-fold domain-containing protein [Nocardia cyriacigeorgica]